MHPQSKSLLPVMLLLAVPVAGCLGPFKDVGDLDDTGESSAGESYTSTSTSGSEGDTSSGPSTTDSPGDSEGGSTSGDPTGDDSTGDDTTGGEPVCDNGVVTLDDVFETIAFDLENTNAADQPFIRYFTLTHLHNAGVCPEAIAGYREAIGKLINSLSSAVQIDAPQSIDELGLIIKIDLRDYDWDDPLGIFADKWEALVASSPYAVEYLETEAEDIKDLTQTSIPMLPGDAFIEFASQPGAAIGNGTNVGYHEFANIPANTVELQIQLGINIEDDIDDRNVARAGLINSDVSTQNRIIERHEAGFFGAMWLAYDFADDSIEEQNIFSNPLEFEHTALEVIFPLPNGLQGYMLALANGQRVDVVSDDIVIDPSQFVNGVSCFGCHPRLFTNSPDDVRPYVFDGPGILQFNAHERNAIEEMYVPDADFQDLLAQDNAVFHSAVTQAGADPDATLEPITNVVDRFAGDVDIKLAAAELGISEDLLLPQLGALDPALVPFVSGGSVTRELWTSLYADTVCKLNIGIAPDDDCE